MCFFLICPLPLLTSVYPIKQVRHLGISSNSPFTLRHHWCRHKIKITLSHNCLYLLIIFQIDFWLLIPKIATLSHNLLNQFWMCFLIHTCYHYLSAQGRIWNRNLLLLEIHGKKKFLSLSLRAEETRSRPRVVYWRGKEVLRYCYVNTWEEWEKPKQNSTKQKQKLSGLKAPQAKGNKVPRRCWAGCEMPPNWLCVWTLGPQLEALFGEAVGPFRSGD